MFGKIDSRSFFNFHDITDSKIYLDCHVVLVSVRLPKLWLGFFFFQIYSHKSCAVKKLQWNRYLVVCPFESSLWLSGFCKFEKRKPFLLWPFFLVFFRNRILFLLFVQIFVPLTIKHPLIITFVIISHFNHNVVIWGTTQIDRPPLSSSSSSAESIGVEGIPSTSASRNGTMSITSPTTSESPIIWVNRK